MQTGDEHDGHHRKGVFEEQKNTERIKPPCERVTLAYQEGSIQFNARDENTNADRENTKVDSREVINSKYAGYRD